MPRPTRLEQQLEKLLTPEEAADMLGLTVGALASLRYESKGPAYQRLSPRKIRYRESALAAFVEATTKQGTAEYV